MITADDLVRREVHYCASHVVATVASGAHAINSRSECSAPLSEAAEQAFDLSSPIPDAEEAALQNGWTYHKSPLSGTPSFQHAEHGTHVGYDGWQDLCDDFGLDPYDYARDVFEHWIVSNWLADKLAEHGEKVDKDFMGLTVWARTTTGQGIASDHVIEKITAELNTARRGVPLFDPENKLSPNHGEVPS